jgi:hypothetical protein
MSRLNVVTSTNDFTCYTKSQATVVGFACVLAAIIALAIIGCVLTLCAPSIFWSGCFSCAVVPTDKEAIQCECFITQELAVRVFERILRDFERAYGDYFSTWELLEGVMERLRNRMVRSMVVRNRSAEKH